MTNEPIVPVFRTTDEVAPELGMTTTELRRYCRESGIHTRRSNRCPMLHQDDIECLVVQVRQRQDEADEWWNEPKRDPFAWLPAPHLHGRARTSF